MSGNREKILSYAKKSGIVFTLANEEVLPVDENFINLKMIHDVLKHLKDESVVSELFR